MELRVNGVDRTGKLAESASNPRYNDTINMRSQFGFTLHDPTNTLALEIGQEVKFWRGASVGTPDFGGTIDRLSDTIIGDKTSTLHQIVAECVSFDHLMDRFFVAGSFAAQPVGDLVREIAALMADDDVTTDNVVAVGPTVGPFTFRYEYIVDVFQFLADLTGMIYFIDGDRDLYFNARTAASLSSLSLTDANYNAVSLTVTRSREKYRNVQYIRGGVDLTDTRVETFVGDGERQTFNTAFPLGEAPTIEVDGVPKTVGIRSVDTGKDWYWNAGVNEVSQENTHTPLTSSQVLEVTYKGQFPILVQARDEGEIASRMAIEGGSGVYEQMESQTTIEDADIAMDLALARLDEQGFIPKTVVAVTHEGGVRAGMLQPVSLTAEGLSGDFLVSDVRASCRFGEEFEYHITMLDGTGVGGWDQFFRRLLSQKATRTQSEDETVLLLRSKFETVTADDDIAATTAAPETRVGFLEIGYGEIG